MRLPETRLAVFVSLPRNDATLADEARRAGAHGLKVHVNVHHRASGTRFRSVEEEREALEAVLAVGLPTGLVVGSGPVSAKQMRAAAGMGFDYFDAYAADAPADYVTACGDVTPMVALGPGDGPAQARALTDRGVRALEASTLEPDRYGTPLSLATLARLTSVASAVDVPVLHPSQHSLRPEDLAAIADTGARAVLLGSVVLGTDPGAFGERLSEFVQAAARLGAPVTSRA